MAAQHLPQDIVRPSSGLEELAQTMKNVHTKCCISDSALASLLITSTPCLNLLAGNSTPPIFSALFSGAFK